MKLYSKLYENEEEDLYLLMDRDLVLRVKPPGTIDDVIRALENKNNYGRYISTMRSAKVSDKDVEEYFGPRSVRVREKNETERYAKFKEQNPESDMSFSDWKTKGPAGTDIGPYPVRTKDNYDAFVSQFITKPNLLNYYPTTIKGEKVLIFPKNTNKGRNEIKSIVSTVLSNIKDENNNPLFPEGAYKFTAETIEENKKIKNTVKKLVEERYKRLKK